MTTLAIHAKQQSGNWMKSAILNIKAPTGGNPAPVGWPQILRSKIILHSQAAFDLLLDEVDHLGLKTDAIERVDLLYAGGAGHVNFG